MAEKLRAITFIHYYPRNRDLYDICYLNKNERINLSAVIKLFKSKCKFKGIDPALIKNINDSYLNRFNKSWNIQLGHQIKKLPSFGVVKKEFLSFVKRIKIA